MDNTLLVQLRKWISHGYRALAGERVRPKQAEDGSGNPGLLDDLGL